MITRQRRRVLPALIGLAFVTFWSTNGFAQLDPLLFVKRVHPTVILVVDTSIRMLTDNGLDYYDPHTYNVVDDPTVATAMEVPLGATMYRRIYKNFKYTNPQDGSATKFDADDIDPVVTADANDMTFWDATRLQIAKKGIARAVEQNEASAYRWGLIKLRQDNPAWRTGGNCDKPVKILNDPVLKVEEDENPCNAGGDKLGVYVPTVAQSNYDIESGNSGIVVAPAANTAANILQIVNRPILDTSGTNLIPAGGGSRNFQDRPLTHALDDARAQAVSIMEADSLRDCRNTVVVLITGGKDDGSQTYRDTHSVTATASTFASVTAGGVTRRVPIYVAAVKPVAADETQLQQVATDSGGRYFKVTDVDGVARVINLAVQAGFSRAGEHDTSTKSESQSVSPIVGTVNLKNASSAANVSLPNTEIKRWAVCDTVQGTEVFPQRSNLILTSAFTLPDLEGRLRAFRAYRPVADCAKPSGWKFVADGTPLWPDIDSPARPQLAGLARVPADPNNRNIFTRVPVNGTWTTVPFTTANVTSAHLGGADPNVLIPYIRSQPLGAVIGSTPAIMDAPSLDPPPDDDYGRVGVAGSYADTYKDRRSIIWFGANDGMIHAVDARTGFEVWAFIPYNLLPKLRALLDGQSMHRFDYFVDSSPKIAEVKIVPPGGGVRQWRTVMIIGEGAGGTFYQAFDVTKAGTGVAPENGALSDVESLLDTFDGVGDPELPVFMWSFPEYSHFDPSITTTLTINDGTTDEMTFYGELNGSATTAERTVGFTWSDPAVGPLNQARTVNAVIVGSGYFPNVEGSLPNRSTTNTAGPAIYLIDIETGQLVGNAGGACGGTGCLHVGDAGGATPKNALQADPTATTDFGSHIVTKAYLGDLDGRYWKFSFTEAGAITSNQMIDTGKPIYSSSALLLVGTVNQYMFFSTGSDLLPPTATNATGTFNLYGLKDLGTSGETVFTPRPLAAVSDSGGLATGERPSSSPSVAGDIVFFTSTTENGAAPCAEFTAKLYGLTYLGGTAYDTDSTAGIQQGESPVIASISGRATAPFIVDQHLYFGAVGATGGVGSQLQAFGDPEDFNNGVGQVGVRILSWRELR